jgi:hypothetical protein
MLYDPKSFFYEDDSFQSKFLRLGNDIYITEPNDLKTYHKELAEKDKILEKVEYLISNNPDEIDGGIIFIRGKIISIGMTSSGFQIPKTERARRLTVQRLQKQNPQFSIRELHHE